MRGRGSRRDLAVPARVRLRLDKRLVVGAVSNDCEGNVRICLRALRDGVGRRQNEVCPLDQTSSGSVELLAPSALRSNRSYAWYTRWSASRYSSKARTSGERHTQSAARHCRGQPAAAIAGGLPHDQLIPLPDAGRAGADRWLVHEHIAGAANGVRPIGARHGRATDGTWAPRWNTKRSALAQDEKRSAAGSSTHHPSDWARGRQTDSWCQGITSELSQRITRAT